VQIQIDRRQVLFVCVKFDDRFPVCRGPGFDIINDRFADPPVLTINVHTQSVQHRVRCIRVFPVAVRIFRKNILRQHKRRGDPARRAFVIHNEQFFFPDILSQRGFIRITFIPHIYSFAPQFFSGHAVHQNELFQIIKISKSYIHFSASFMSVFYHASADFEIND